MEIGLKLFAIFTGNAMIMNKKFMENPYYAMAIRSHITIPARRS